MNNRHDPCPETLPIIYIHHGPQGDLVYADQSVLIVHVDEGQPHDRVFVRLSCEPPSDLIHGPTGCSHLGGEIGVARKERLVAWLERVGMGLTTLVKGEVKQ